jgi:hypothetical protein
MNRGREKDRLTIDGNDMGIQGLRDEAGQRPGSSNSEIGGRDDGVGRGRRSLAMARWPAVRRGTMERGYSLRRDATPQTRAHLKSNPIFRRERERETYA